MKIFIQVIRTDGNRVILALDKLERVEEEKDKNTSTVIHNGERIMVGESFDCVMKRMERAIEEANR